MFPGVPVRSGSCPWRPPNCYQNLNKAQKFALGCSGGPESPPTVGTNSGHKVNSAAGLCSQSQHEAAAEYTSPTSWARIGKRYWHSLESGQVTAHIPLGFALSRYFQSMLKQCLQLCPHSEKVTWVQFVDDLLLSTLTPDLCLQATEAVLLHLAKACFKVSKEKLQAVRTRLFFRMYYFTFWDRLVQ